MIKATWIVTAAALLLSGVAVGCGGEDEAEQQGAT
jgi:hypothetical protein